MAYGHGIRVGEEQLPRRAHKFDCSGRPVVCAARPIYSGAARVTKPHASGSAARSLLLTPKATSRRRRVPSRAARHASSSDRLGSQLARSIAFGRHGGCAGGGHGAGAPHGRDGLPRLSWRTTEVACRRHSMLPDLAYIKLRIRHGGSPKMVLTDMFLLLTTDICFCCQPIKNVYV